MAEDDDQKYGVTGAATFKDSSPVAIERSSELAKYLEKAEFFESEESAQIRERVLGRLDFLLKRFVDGLSAHGAEKRTGGKIYTFGSYRLGVHDRDADIDALCAVPRHVHRRDFFTIFYEQLRLDPNVAELSKVEDAYVPLIKMQFCGIPIDLTFARLNLPVVHEHLNLLNDSLLRSMDEKCIVSLNGSRVTDAMLSLIPCTEVFHAALRAVKFWAKRRFIYGATYGYFGGVAFSICVARVCQMYPCYSAYDILCKFFEVYTAWKWPVPVILRPVVDLNYHLKVWDPKVYPADKYNKMPVITPAYPSMCSTSNVTQSTSALVTTEFARAHEILKSSNGFEQIFDFTDFFKKYKLFVEVFVQCADSDEYLIWSGYIESKVRILASKIEGVENVSAAIPFPKAFKSGPTQACTTGDSKGSEDVASAEKVKKFKSASSSDDFIAPGEQRNALRLCGPASSCARSEAADPYDREPKDENEKNDGIVAGAAQRKPENIPVISLGNSGDLDKKVVGDSSPHGIPAPASIFLEPSEPSLLTTSFFIAVDVTVSKATNKKFYIDGPIKEFLDFINAWDKKTGNMSVDVRAKKRKDVQRFVKNFYSDE